MSVANISNRFDAAIFVTITLVLLALFVLLVSNLVLQYASYNEAIIAALSRSPIDHASVLSYSRAWDFAVVKTSALFLSFLLIFSGALYVLRAGETNFQLTAKNADFRGSLSLNSPGLVMVTLGTFLAAYVISTKSLVEYRGQVEQPYSEIRRKQALTPIESTLRSSERLENIDG